jgi:hypothetical protein
MSQETKPQTPGWQQETPAPGSGEKPPTIWAVWMPFKKSGFPSLGTFGARERKVVIVPMETWNALCAEIPALRTKQFIVGSYDE